MVIKEKTYSFSLAKITTEQFAIVDECYNNEGKISIETSIRFGADNQRQMIATFTLFKFICNEKPFIVIEAGCHFIINPESWKTIFNTEKQELTVPKVLLRHLAMLTVGTTRGILHSKTENTNFNQFVLPTINVSGMISDDAIFGVNTP